MITLLITIVCIACFSGCGKTIELPYELDGGNLVVNSLFNSTFNNPDNDFIQGQDIGAIELENKSGKFLESATVEVKMKDGTELSFTIEEIPDGKTVYAFDTNNTALADIDGEIKSIECSDAEYADKAALMKKQIKVTDDGTINVTVKNISDQDIENLRLDFHACLDDVYYGGKVVHSDIDSLKAGDKEELQVAECYLGEAQMVKASLKDKK